MSDVVSSQAPQAPHVGHASPATQASPAAQVIRASDAERDEVVALLQRHFADGRLAQDEFDERASAALAARTRDQLHVLTADLPGTVPSTTVPSTTVPSTTARPEPPGVTLEPWLLCLLLWVCPPAGFAYWLLTRRRTCREGGETGEAIEAREPGEATA